MSVIPPDDSRTTLIFVVSPLAFGPIARYRVLIGKLCADAVAFRKPAGIAATKPRSVPAARPEADVLADTVVKLAVVGVGFDEVEVCAVAEGATERDEDPQPARASAAVAASATAPYRIDDRESAMLTGLLLGDREMWMPSRRPSPVPLLGREGMATGSASERRQGRGHGSRPHAPQVSTDTPRGVGAVGSQL